MRIENFNKLSRQIRILLSISFLILFSIDASSALDKTYYWIPSSGSIDSSGFTANWGNCNAQPTSYRITKLSDTGFTCSSDRLTKTSSGDQFLAIFPSAYSSDTQVTGKTGATFFLASQRSGYTATYRFDLGYAKDGTFTSLGYVTQSVSSSNGQKYTIDLGSISGTAPSGSYPALKVSTTTSRGGRVYPGTNGGSTGSNSGRFYVNETVASEPTYNVSISASPASSGITAGNSHLYSITVNNTGNANGNYALSVTDSDTVNFAGSTPDTAALQINSGSSAITTLNVTAKTNALTDAIDNTTVTVISVENSAFSNSAGVQTMVTAPTSAPSPSIMKVSTNRFVVLDDPADGSAGSGGFFNPSDTRGRSWGSNYWSGESTTIRANAIVMNNYGSKQPGVTVTFTLKNPGGSTVNTASSITNGEGAAYYSFDMNARNYWGNWEVEATATVGSNTITDNTSFASNWWGCPQCHNSESPGKWGTKYTPKSYYTMGYDFHRSQNKNEHTDAMAKGTCIICHQSYNGTPKNWGFNDNSPGITEDNEYSPDWHKGKVVCSGCHAGSNISTTPQRKNPEIAGCYDMPGCHQNKNSNVSRENSTSGYVVGGNYRSLYSNIPISADSHTITSVNCIICHNAGHNIDKPDNSSITSNSITENEQCWTCHTQRTDIHYGESCTGCHSQDIHNASVSGGGPDCISCHGLTGNAEHKVDSGAVAAGVHNNLNSGASASGVPAENKKCWGCHQSDGNQPAGMGDKYISPYGCYECHGPTKPYPGVSSAFTVNEHFKSGADIKAGLFAIDDSSSCAVCHNVPEMTVSYTDNESTELSIGSHYGKSISVILDCQYCHQNASTSFSAAMMSNIRNNNLSNHSRDPQTPVCTTCHGSGMLHDAVLTMPASSNDTYCKTCHGNRDEHKTVYCAECHTNNSNRSTAGREIHGIGYLQKDNTVSTEKTNVADCTTCHQSDAVNSSLLLAPPQVSDPLHHSDDLNNGSIWGSYWTNQLDACLYCHNDTRHSATPLGRPLTWSYVMNTVIGSGTNCADCHYKGDTNYAGMGSAFTMAGKLLPPEITNGSWNGKSGYYNHSLNEYTDVQCKVCHYKGTGSTVGQMLHDVSEGGSGGPDCKSCHDSGSTLAPKLVNFSAMNSSSAGHKNLNSGASATVDAENKKCWACHGDGAQPGGHPDSYKTPTDCQNCHAGAGSYSAPIVAEHQQAGQDVITATSCTDCHDNNGMYISGTDAGSVNHYVKDVTDKTATPYGHSGTIDTSACILCHNGPYTNDPEWGMPVNISILPGRPHAETLTSECDTCHKDASVSTLANVDFHNAAIKAGAGGDNCLGCHAGNQ